jgi:methionyl-tRNA synthetase
MSKFFITTSIAYTNAPPHIGYAMELVQGDVLARLHRGRQDEVWYLTGTDEHGVKIARAAEEAKLTPQLYVDNMSEQFRDLCVMLNITNDQFIRTSDASHKKAAQALWKACAKDIYKASYKGWYCVGCETFYTDIDVADHVCPIHKVKLEEVEEENYFFKLSNYTGAIKALITSDKLSVQPASRKNEIMALLERGLEDISISRDIKQLKWGIEVPDDPKQVMYVWFDALANYITALGYPKSDKLAKFWPADVQIIGKDILRHHAAIWPAMLMSAELPLPSTLYVHGFITSEGQKMSKSLGNVISPREVVDKYGVDALRYYLLREIPADGDGDFSWTRMEVLYNADLANELGNLVQRVAMMVVKYFGGVTGDIIPHSHDAAPYHEALKAFRFDRALEEVWALVKGLNIYLEEEKPWKLAGVDNEQLLIVLHHALSDLDQIGALLLPFLPATSQKITATFANGKVDLGVGLLFPKFDVITKTDVDIKG